MYGIIKSLYSESKQQAFEKLYNDSDSKTQLIMRSVIAEAFKDCPRILESHGSDWILCTLSSYKKSEEDTMRIFQSIMNMFDRVTFGLLTTRIQWRSMNNVADSCLVGLGFFRKYMEELNKRKAAPSPDYYAKAGALAFQRLGFEEIGEDFSGWTNFIEKEFVI